MNDFNWKTWGLVFVLVLGAAFETFKRMPAAQEKWSADVLKMPTDSPYQVKSRAGQTPPGMIAMGSAPRAQHVAGNAEINRATIEKFIAANTPHKGEFNHAMKEGEGKDVKKLKKKKKDDDEYEIVVDPRTGKRYRRKKKKIAKVEEVKPYVEQKEEKKTEVEKEDDAGAVTDQAIAGGQPPAGKSDSPHADLEEWKRRLLSHPDAAETRRFIEHYKNGIVTAEIYYKIIALMMEDSRPQMKELGVQCAGLTPSVLSFQVLAEAVKNERSGSTVRKYSESYLNQYSALGNLTILERLMKSPPSDFVALQATKKLDASVKIYLAPAKNKVPPGAAASSLTTHSNAGYFKRFVTTLQTLSKDSDATVADQAKTTLATMQKMMDLSNSPQTIAPPAQASAR